jgi:hypothetical protein
MKINKPHFDIKILAYLCCGERGGEYVTIYSQLLQSPVLTCSKITILLSTTQSTKLVTLLPDLTQQYNCSSELRK